MDASQLSVFFFLQMFFILAVCRGVGWLARQVGQPQVVGEMIAGVLLGPSLFGLLLPEYQQIAVSQRDAQDALCRGAVGRRLVHVPGRRRIPHRSVSLTRPQRSIGVPRRHARPVRPRRAPGALAARTSRAVLGQGDALSGDPVSGRGDLDYRLPDAGADHLRAGVDRYGVGDAGAVGRRDRRCRGVVRARHRAGELWRRCRGGREGDCRRRRLCRLRAHHRIAPVDPARGSRSSGRAR